MTKDYALELKENDRDASLLDVGLRLGEIVQASNLCLNSRFPAAAISLMYVVLDTAANLDFRLRKEKPRHRFLKWVERYILSDGDLPCSALDLYGSRCGILHTYSSRSNLSAKGHAREIWYTFHEEETDALREAVREADY